MVRKYEYPYQNVIITILSLSFDIYALVFLVISFFFYKNSITNINYECEGWMMVIVKKSVFFMISFENYCLRWGGKWISSTVTINLSFFYDFI